MTLLVSSMSARGRALNYGRDLARTLGRGGWEVEVKVTTSEHDVEVEASKVDSPFVAALGGDGYITTAARGVLGTQTPLVPIPLGRGNDTCRALGIGANAGRWVRKLADADASEVSSWVCDMDAMSVTSNGHEEIALGIVSLGIDATANMVANRAWIRSGPVAYAWGAVYGFLGKHKPVRMEALVDGRDEEVGGWLCSISNSGWFGGGVNLVPGSQFDDGILELVSVEPMSRLRVLRPLVRALTARSAHDPIIKVKEGRVFKLIGPAGIIAMADGDYVGQTPLEIRVLSRALKVVAGKQEQE